MPNPDTPIAHVRIDLLAGSPWHASLELRIDCWRARVARLMARADVELGEPPAAALGAAPAPPA